MTIQAHDLKGRVHLADDALAAYDFGRGTVVQGHDNWNRDDPDDLTKIVYVTFDDDPPETDSQRVSFHVRFSGDGSIEDVYGLLMSTGDEIGAWAREGI